VNVISLKQIKDFGRNYADSRDTLSSWYYEACAADWNNPQDIKDRFHSASFLGNNVVIFNIKGNKYRLVTKVSYQNKVVFIKWIGTHAEYDKKDFND
jgi:mRNA interferase HigB